MAIHSFSEVLTLPAARVAFLQFIREERAEMQNLLKYATSIHADEQGVHALFCLVSIMLDTDLSLLAVDDERYMACSLPSAKHLAAITKCALAHIATPEFDIQSLAMLSIVQLLSNR